MDDAFKNISEKIWGNMLILNKKIEEKALTIDVLIALKKLNSDRLLAIKGVNEDKFGADIEWWIVFPGNEFHEPEVLHMRIQAKRLHMMEHVDHIYRDLHHKKGKQLDDLIAGASDIGAIPLYCFYNYYINTPNSYQKKADPVEDGWRYAYASEIKDTREKSFSTYNQLSTIDPLTMPMYRLAIIAEKNPREILLDYEKHGGSVDQLLKKQLPNYVFKELEDYEYPDGRFFKETDWFRGISKMKKENKTKKSERTIRALVRQMLNQLMYFAGYKKRCLPSLIITIAEEPMKIE